MISVSESQFRSVMGCFPTGVTVVSFLDAERQPVGVTIGSFTSVSLDPPLILFCLTKTARQFSRFKSAEYFAVNILAADQADLCRHFARAGTQRVWDDIAFEGGPFGSPVLDDCLAWMECKRAKHYAGGDHIIFLGQVLALNVEDNTDSARPLLYYRSALFPDEGKNRKRKTMFTG